MTSGLAPTQISAEDVWYSYKDGTVALKGATLRIDKGEFVALLGQNGSGKTTLAKTFNGLLKPSKGRVFVEGTDTGQTSVAALSRVVGYVFQNPDHQIFGRTLHEEITFGLRNMAFPESEFDSRAKEVLKKVDLAKPLDANPHFFSLGERHRTAIASVLVLEPSVLILDEPTTGLDYKRCISLMQTVEKLNKEGRTIVLITHDVNLAARYSHRTIILKDGKILAEGPSRQILSDSELLMQSNIVPPQINALSRRLSDLGFPSDVVTVDEFVELILSKIKS